MMKIIDEEILKAYDRKKGTAVKEVNAIPSTVENRVYIIDGKIYVKSIEIATKSYADTFIPLTQKSQANGVATLDANGHVPVEQMPTQALIFKGYWDASTGVLPTAGTVIGDFYIVSVDGEIGTTIYRTGDWIIWDGSGWTLSRNTNAVASVNGQTGSVVVDGSNIQATYEGSTDTINSLLTQVGKVKTVNNQLPDSNGNIQIDLSTTGVIEASALSNVGTAANASQQDINTAIDNQLASHTWSVTNWTLAYS